MTNATAVAMEPELAPVAHKFKLFETAAEWQAFRRRHIGASEIAAVLGEDRFGTAHSVYCRKVLGEDGRDATLRMRLGLELEDFIARVFEERSGYRCVKPPHLAAAEHPEVSILSATPDRFVVGGAEDLMIGELKLLSEFALAAAKGGPLFSHVLQVQQQLDVFGLEVGFIAAVSEVDAYYWRVDRDPDLQRAIREGGRKFWDEHVLKMTPPPVDGSEQCRRMLQALYPDHEGEADLDPGMHAVCIELESLKEEARQTEARIEYCKNLLLDAIGPRKIGWLKPDLLPEKFPVRGYRLTPVKGSQSVKCAIADKPRLEAAHIPHEVSERKPSVRLDTLKA